MVLIPIFFSIPVFFLVEHSNYFGVDEKLGPVAVSIKREKLEDHKDHGPQYQYRIIFRTSEVPQTQDWEAGSIPAYPVSIGLFPSFPSSSPSVAPSWKMPPPPPPSTGRCGASR